VPEELLDVPDVGALPQQVDGDRVAQQVRVDVKPERPRGARQPVEVLVSASALYRWLLCTYDFVTAPSTSMSGSST
jgi:hypothetical protein